METRPIPELEAVNPEERLVEFYQKLGWDGKAVVDTSRVRLTLEDWMCLIENERQFARNQADGDSAVVAKAGLKAGLFWMNYGPSGDGQTPGRVELLPGWLAEN